MSVLPHTGPVRSALRRVACLSSTTVPGVHGDTGHARSGRGTAPRAGRAISGLGNGGGL